MPVRVKTKLYHKSKNKKLFMLIHSDYFIPVNFNNTENKLKHKTILLNSEKTVLSKTISFFKILFNSIKK